MVWLSIHSIIHYLYRTVKEMGAAIYGHALYRIPMLEALAEVKSSDGPELRLDGLYFVP